jgi:DNA-binding FadR family transcriptional regulator
LQAGLDRMRAADDGRDNALDADIAFHMAVLRASKNPFYAQFQSVVATALRTSIQVTNRIRGRSANLEDHAAVADAIAARDIHAARIAMRRIIVDVIAVIADKTVRRATPDGGGDS